MCNGEKFAKRTKQYNSKHQYLGKTAPRRRLLNKYLQGVREPGRHVGTAVQAGGPVQRP